MMPRRPAWGIPLALGLLVLAVYLLTASSDLKNNGDSLLRFQVTQAMVDGHHLWLGHPSALDLRVTRGRGHHLYASYGPGQSVLMVPFYVAGRVAAHHLGLDYDITTRYATRCLDLVLGALIAVGIFLFGRRLGYGDEVSAILALMWAFCTAAWPDAQGGLEQTQVEIFLFVAVFATWRALGSAATNRTWLMIAGAGAGLAFWTRYDALIYIVILAGSIATVRWWQDATRSGVTQAGIFLAGSFPWIAFVALWDTLTFGAPWFTGTHPQTFGTDVLGGFLGLTVSPGKGILWYVPVVFLLLFAARTFARRQPLAAGIFTAVVGLTVAFYSVVLYWHGDPAWGPRYLYPVLPFLILPMGELLARWRSYATAFRATILCVIALSLGVQVVAVSVTPWRFWYRIEALQEQTVNVASWTGTPFLWGPTHYHFYWDATRSPLLFQADDVYQVLRLQLGTQRYRLTVKPDPYIGANTSETYPVNTFQFWWADVRHPPLGPTRRSLLVAMLVLLGALSGAGLIRMLSRERLPTPLVQVNVASRESSAGS